MQWIIIQNQYAGHVSYIWGIVGECEQYINNDDRCLTFVLSCDDYDIRVYINAEDYVGIWYCLENGDEIYIVNVYLYEQADMNFPFFIFIQRHGFNCWNFLN